jgi:glycosyltransferase involved in cell wall biosynthesis
MIHEKFPQLLPKAHEFASLKLKSIQRADLLICISNSTRCDLLELCDVPEEKVFVVYLGYELAHAKVLSPMAAQRSRPYLLYVGRRGGYKNFARLLEAYALSECRKEAELLCFGPDPFDSSERETIRNLGLSSGEVATLCGDDSMLSSLYRGALAMVYPSLYEGFGIPLLEAMSFGCPVVCSNTSVFREVVGDAGLFFEPDNVESIAAALNTAIRRHYFIKLLRAKGLERVKEFGWAKCAEQTYSLYRKLV